MLTLSLEKPGADAPKLRLSLNKGARFTAKVEWQCDADHADDVDVHALEACNTGSGAKVTALEQVLSTYNTKRMNPQVGALPNNPDGSFQTAGGGLVHSGDKRVQNNTESIVIDGSKLPDGVTRSRSSSPSTRPDMAPASSPGSTGRRNTAFGRPSVAVH